MMLRHLGELTAADAVEAAIADVLAQGNVRTSDIGGTASTEDLGAAIASQVNQQK
jgi:tartrate dehydrogenase/decarboxylase/D-malate dehydrogenase